MKNFLYVCAEGFILTLLFLAVPVSVLFDLTYLGNCVAERGLTENYQIIMLLLINILLWKSVLMDKKGVSLSVLIASFFSIVLIRELDWLFDIISHGSWKYFAITLTLICLAISFRHRKGFKVSLDSFTDSKYYHLFIVGLIMVLFFSRFIGTKHLWLQILDYEQAKSVKNIVQESLEAFGYVLIFLACCTQHREYKKRVITK